MMFAFSTRLSNNFGVAVVSLGDKAAAVCGVRSSELTKEALRWAAQFVSKFVDRESGGLVPAVAGKDPIYLTEVWLRYVRLNVMRVLHTAGPTIMPDIEAVRARRTLQARHTLGSFYLKEERFLSLPVIKLLPQGFRKLAEIESPHCALWDITSARLFFSRANSIPIPDETSWELCKRFDPSASRQMHQGHFYSLLPRSWREMRNYQKVTATYADCLAAEKWFSEAKPSADETSWELCKRFDLSASRQMHQSHFYSLLPRSWREMQNYQKIDATYADCVAAEKWFNEAKPSVEETSWELYKRFDPSGSRQMHQRQFYSLLPRSWREMRNYQMVNATYADCLAAETWFNEAKPRADETSWELYKRFDPSGSRQMNQGQFYSLLPRSWREMQNYQMVKATYADCLAAEKWFSEANPSADETSWELYKRFDPSGARQMNQGQFYSLLPSSWREMQNYQMVNATYADCLAAETWFNEAKPSVEGTSWELYKRFDPSGSRQMNQGHFYSLLPRSWRGMQNYQMVNATYADCVAIELAFGAVTPRTMRDFVVKAIAS